jgi:predicted amidohydrolase
MKVAIAQIDCQPGDINANCQKIVDFAVRAKQENADLLVFPELSDTGYVMTSMEDNASEFKSGLPIRTLSDCATSNGMSIIAGISEKTDEGIYNSAVAINPDGDIIAKYRKVHLYTPSGEDVFKAGHELVTFSLGEFTMGLMICYDIRFPEMARSLALKGVDVIVVPTAWPFPRVEHWQLLTRVRAIENQCYLIGANRVGTDETAYLSGNSRMVDPHGVIVCSASEDQEEIIFGDMAKEKIQFIRKRMPVFDHRRSDIYLT